MRYLFSIFSDNLKMGKWKKRAMYHLLWCLLGCFSKASVLVLWHKGISDEASRDTHKNSWNTGDAQSADAKKKKIGSLLVYCTYFHPFEMAVLWISVEMQTCSSDCFVSVLSCCILSCSISYSIRPTQSLTVESIDMYTRLNQTLGQLVKCIDSHRSMALHYFIGKSVINTGGVGMGSWERKLYIWKKNIFRG